MSAPRGTAFSETWWGSRWIQSLRRFGRGWSRGLTDARGATEGIRDLTIAPGLIEAVVPDDGETYQLQMRLEILHDAAWRRVLRRLAGKALYTAKLLSGEMPRDVERVFAQCRASLFPRRGREITSSCSCEQEEFPCTHVAAVQFVLAEAFDHDPFLLFELRGRSREQVLAELREIRGAGARNGGPGAEALSEEDAWPEPRPEDYTVAGEDLGTVGFHIAAAEETVGSIRALGPPRSWPQPLEVLKAFVPLYRAASAVALDIAWTGEEKIPATAQLPPPESEAALVAMAESMAVPTLQSEDEKPPSRRRGGRKRGGRRRRGRRGQGRGEPAAPGRRRRKAGGEAAAQGGKQATAGQPGKKRRRRRGRGGSGGAGVAAGGAGGGGSSSGGGGGSGGGSGSGSGGGGKAPAEQTNKRRRRRRRRGGGGGGGGGKPA